MNTRRAFVIAGIALGASACASAPLEPAARGARERIVLTPQRIAFVTSERSSSGSSGELHFGGPLGRSALYLRFPSEWRSRGVPQQAFLTLTARVGSASADIPITLEAWRINSDWQPRSLQHWSEKPSLALPFSRAIVTASASRELRIDVSEIVHFAAQNPEREFGIAVIASGSEGPAATFSPGFAGGSEPRLQVYLR